MVSNLGILCVILSVKCCLSWHCTEDVDISESQELEYNVNTHPTMDTKLGYWKEEVPAGTDPAKAWTFSNRYRAIAPRSKAEDPSTEYWGTKMIFYWFGTITDANAFITGGMYDPDEDDQLVYGVTIDCASMKWMTVYQNSSMGQQAKWKEGALWKACKAGDIFDLIFEMTQRRRGSFIFNGQPLEDAVYPIIKQGENTGNYRSQKLPVNLTFGTKIKGTAQGGTFSRYTYGKCYAFPRAYLGDCLGAKAWVSARNKVTNMNLVTFNNDNFDAQEPFPITEDAYSTDLKALGANNIYATVACRVLPEGTYFDYKQSGIHADHNTDTYPAVCCAYMNGTLADSTCESYKTGQYMTCLRYTMWKTKYAGLEEYYLGDLSDEEAGVRTLEMQRKIDNNNALIAAGEMDNNQLM